MKCWQVENFTTSFLKKECTFLQSIFKVKSYISNRNIIYLLDFYSFTCFRFIIENQRFGPNESADEKILIN